MKKLFTVFSFALATLLVGLYVTNARPGEAVGHVEISSTTFMSAALSDSDYFGGYPVVIGDVDGDGVEDIAVTAGGDDGGGTDRGAVYILFMDADGTLDDDTPYAKISGNSGGMSGVWTDSDQIGSEWGVAPLGDVDGDGTPDIAIGTRYDDDVGTDRGAVYVLFLDPDGSIDEANGPGAGYAKFSESSTEFTATLEDGGGFGRRVEAVGDVNGDGTTDIAVSAQYETGGGFNRGAMYLLFLDPDGTLDDTVPYTKFASGTGGMPTFSENLQFGAVLESMGDINGDDVPDLAVGTRYDDDGGTDRGGFYLLFLDADGTLHDSLAYSKFSDTAGGFEATLDDGDRFAITLANVGDINGDGVNDIVAGAMNDDDGGASNSGAIYILFLDADGTLDDTTPYAKISNATPGFTNVLAASTFFGTSPSLIGDINGDGINDLAVGATGDDDGGTDRGATYILMLTRTGALHPNTPYVKLSSTSGNLRVPLQNSDFFGNPYYVGDTDGDGYPNLAVGSTGDDGAGTDRGALYIIQLDATLDVSASVPATPSISIESGEECTNSRTINVRVDSLVGTTVTVADNERFLNARTYSAEDATELGWQIPESVEVGEPYELFAFARGINGNRSAISTRSILLLDASECDYPEPQVEMINPIMAVVVGDVITADNGETFYYVAANGVKRLFPTTAILNSWLVPGIATQVVNTATLESLVTGEPMLPKGPAIVQFPENPNYHYISGLNGSPREITTPGLVNELFAGTAWLTHVQTLPTGLQSQITKGRVINKFELGIVTEWREYIRSL